MEFLISAMWVLLGFWASHLAKKRGRNPVGWFFIGLLFGIFGVLVLWFLPPLEVVKPMQPVLVPLTPTCKHWYYVDSDYNRQGPVSAASLKSLFGNQAITTETLVWCEGMSDWQMFRATELN